MNETQRVFSPNKRYYFLLSSYEVRMSHWITSAALWEATSERELLLLGNAWWSTDHIVWQEDSAHASASLRRYPGDVPGLRIDIYPQSREILMHTPTGTTLLSFEALEQTLEDYYAQQSRALPRDTRRT